MIDDGERRTLAAMEEMLRAQDPAFVRRFGAQRQRRRRARIWLAVLALVAAIAMTVTALRYRNVPAAVAGLVGVGASAGIGITGCGEAQERASDPDQTSLP